MSAHIDRRAVFGMVNRMSPHRTTIPGLLYDPSRHGTPRWYMRRRIAGKWRRARLHGAAFQRPPPLTITPEIAEICAAAAHKLESDALAAPGVPAHVVDGSIRALAERFCQYMAGRVRAGTMAANTLKNRRSVLDRLCAEELKPSMPIGDGPARYLTPQAVRQLRDRIADKPGAARHRVKTLRALYGWAIESGHVDTDPTQGVRTPTQRRGGFTAWSPDQVRQWFDTYPLGTREHLAMALLIFTMQRRGDVIRLGRQHETNIDGITWIMFQQQKGETRNPVRVEIPVIPALARAIDACPSGHMVYLLTGHGQPFASGSSFGNWFRARRVAAGLPDGLAAHGVRKAGGAILAESGCTGLEIDAILGHEDEGSGRVYVKSANRRELARRAVAKMRSADLI